MWRCNGIASVNFANFQASIIGKKYGTRRWPRTKKTLEGTLAFSVAVILGAVLVTDILPRLPYFTSDLKIDWRAFLVSTTLTGICPSSRALIKALLEAMSLQNDNLVVPVY